MMMHADLEPMEIRQSLSDLATELAGGEVADNLASIASSLEDIAASLRVIADEVSPPRRIAWYRRLSHL